nr:NADH dehydrogenase subunit 6 [Leptodora kindtii]
MIMILFLMFPALDHPLAMGTNLILATLLIAATMGVCFTNFWISYTLFLILLGALLVVFVYLSLLASNEKFKMNGSYLMVMVIFMVPLNVFSSEEKMMNSSEMFNKSNEMASTLSKLFSTELYQTTIFLVIYLLFTLIVVVKNTKNDNSPLRSNL